MSKIEWTEQTWNPVIGCSKVSAGCENCYAEKMAGRLAKLLDGPFEEPILAGVGAFHVPALSERLRDEEYDETASLNDRIKNAEFAPAV